MSIKNDKELLWRPGRIYIPAGLFTGIAYEATTGNAIKSVGTGTPDATNLAINEVNTSGITGMLLKTADNTVSTLMEVPSDMDFAQPMYPRVYWTANNTSGTTEWILFHKAYIANTTVLGTAEAAVAMDKVIGAHTMAGVAYTMMRTPEARINGGKFPTNTEMIQITVQMHALVTITLPFFIGLGIRYTPKRLQGTSGMLSPAKGATYIMGNTY